MPESFDLGKAPAAYSRRRKNPPTVRTAFERLALEKATCVRLLPASATTRFATSHSALQRLLAAATLLAACGAEEGPLVGGDPRPNVPTPSLDASAAVAMDASGFHQGAMDAAAVGDGARRSDGARALADGALATTEVCDGLDNDGDGQADNIDVQHDGVCDCLAIATLGGPGRVGSGSVFGAWLDQRSDKGAVRLGDAVLTPELLRKYQVIVAEDLSVNDAYSAAEIDALEAWIKAGGGLLTLIGYAGPEERANANAVLARFGMSYGPEQILQKSGAMTVPIRNWFGPHPVVDGVMKVGVDNGYPVNGAGTVFAREGNYDMLRGMEVGSGHVLVYGDEWITYNSEWSQLGEYQVERLWLNMIKWLTVQRVCQVPVIYL
jgi:hypothetical protein